MSRLDEIKRKLGEFAAADPELKAFGADTHKYVLNPCLTDAQVQEIEQKYNITLPEDYCRFITEVGNGGAGPYYGIHPLEKSFPSRVMEKNPDVMSKPFPLTEPLFMLQGCVGSSNLDEYYTRIETDEDYYDEIMECVGQYNKPKYSQGALSICDYGDGIDFLLVLNGPEKGNIWVDERVDQAGIFPMAPEDKPTIRTPFLDWYENWLDLSLARARGNAPDAGTYFELANQEAAS